MRFAGLSVLKRYSAVVFLMKYPRSLFFFIFLTFTCLALLLCRVLCIQHAQVNPIFHSESPVIDISNGSLYMLQALLERSTFNFVMYYTHWCAQSRKLVYEFHRASRKFEGQVSFIAINCWAGSCRQNGFFHSYPQLFFHHTSYNPLKHMGKHKTSHLTRFIKKAMYPFSYISNNDILRKFIEQGKPLLLAFFNGTNYQDKKYNVFFEAALYSINKATSLQFGVITCFQVAALVALEQFGQVVLLNAFELPQVYPSSLNFTYVSIFQWAEQHKVEYVKELDPDLTESNDFGATMMKNGASLIMFVCKDGKNLSEHLLHLYHQVALSYHNCSCKTRDPSQTFADTFPATGTRHAASRQAGARDRACGVRLENAHVASCQSLPPSSGNRYGVRNVCDVCRECYEMCSCDVTSFPLRTSTSTLSILRNLSSLRNGCSSLRKNYPDSSVLSVCCFQDAIPRFREMILSGGLARSGPKRAGESLRALADDFAILNGSIEEVVSRNDPGILRRILGNLMTMFSSSVAEGDKKFLDGFSRKNSRNVSKAPEYQEYGTCERRGKVRVFDGAGCYSNVTVNFYIMDSRKYWSYALALGVKRDDLEVALVIVDVQNEAQYVLPEDTELTNTTIVEFVMKFTRGNLSRRLRSAPVPSQPCLKGGCVIEVVSSTFTQLVLDTHKVRTLKMLPEVLTVRAVKTEGNIFQIRIVKDVLLMYYTPWCGFCKSVKPIYLALADHYKHLAHVRIARINADINDLPWEYTVDSYPTFLFFPAKRKEMSVMFPDYEDRTLDSFVRFVKKHQRGYEDVTWQEDITWKDDDKWKDDVTWLDHVKILRLEQERKALRKQNYILRWRLRREIERRREAEKKRLAAERQLSELWREKKDELRKRTLENAHIFDELSEVKEQLRTKTMLRKTLEKTILVLQAKNHGLKRTVHVLKPEEPPDRTENPEQ